MFAAILAEHHRRQKDLAPYCALHNFAKRKANQISHIRAHQTSLSCHVGASSAYMEAANKCGNSLSQKAIGQYTMCGQRQRDGKLESYQRKQKDCYICVSLCIYVF